MPAPIDPHIADREYWEMQVTNMLRSGFGVEDISYQFRMRGVRPFQLPEITYFVRKLRAGGLLTKIYNGENMKVQDIIGIEGVLAHLMANGSGFLHSDTGQQVYIPSKLIEHMEVLPGDVLHCHCLHNDPDHVHTAEYRAIRATLVRRLVPLPEGPKPKLVVAPRPPAKAKPEVEDKPAAEVTAKSFQDMTWMEVIKTIATPTPSPDEAGGPVEEPAPEITPATADETERPVLPPVVTAPRQAVPEDLYTAVDEIMNSPRAFMIKDVYVEMCRRDPKNWKDLKLEGRIAQILIAMGERGEVCTAKIYSQTDQKIASVNFYARNLDMMTMVIRGEM